MLTVEQLAAAYRIPAVVLYQMKLAYEEALFRAVKASYQQGLSQAKRQETASLIERLSQYVILIREDAASPHLSCSLSGELLRDYEARRDGKVSLDAPPSEDVLAGV